MFCFLGCEACEILAPWTGINSHTLDVKTKMKPQPLDCQGSPLKRLFFLPWNCFGKLSFLKISSVQSLSRVQLFGTPWTAALQASLSITNSRSLLKLMSIESVMPSNRLILCHPLLLPSIFPSIRVFSNESVLCIRWPKYWSFSCNISPSNEYSGLIFFRMDWLVSLLSKAISRVFSNITVQKH